MATAGFAVHRVELVQEGIDLRDGYGELRIEGMGQMGPERFHTQAEQPWFCVEGVGAAGDLPYEGGELLARNRPVVVVGIDEAHGLNLHCRAVGAHTKNAHRPGPEGAVDDSVCLYRLMHGILSRAQFSILEIMTAIHYTRVSPPLIVHKRDRSSPK